MRRAEVRGALCCLVLLLPGAVSARSYELRYGLVAGQTWHAVQTIFRETTVAGLTKTDRGTARFRYEVGDGAAAGDVRLDARMLSQTLGEQHSPFDFSVIHFVAQMSRRGTLRGKYFQLGDAEPPEVEGIERDPVAFRQMLRSVAASWIEAVYWLPELPERPIAPGESFVIRSGGDVGGTDPGVTMQLESKQSYTLRKVTGRLADFAVQVTSRVDASTAQTGIVSNRTAEGEATFDLELGMWVRHELRSDHRAALHGNAGADQASAHTVTVIEMALGEPPDAESPGDRMGL